MAERPENRPGAPLPYSFFSLVEGGEERLGLESDGHVRDLPVGDDHGLDDVTHDGPLMLDPDVACMFAVGMRAAQPDGIVITGTVESADVLAYITEHEEAEIVVDPRQIELLSAESVAASHSD